MDRSSDPLKDIFSKIQRGERLSFEDGVRLFKSTDILEIGRMAHQIRERMHGRNAFYARNLHINPTNICSLRCEFCAFSRDPDAPGAYSLTVDEIEQKVKDAVDRSQINEVHIVGGHNPALQFDYYLEMIKRMRQVSETVFIKAFSAPEIDFMAKQSGCSWAEVLRRLKEAGLDGMPGGGAEIFDPEVRQRLCPDKISGETWIEIHRIAHQAGIPTNATMLYGHVESDEQRVSHLLRLRELQDATHGFRAFVPFAYQPEHNKLRGMPRASGFSDLKVLSISRLLLDNIPHIKVHGSATGLKFVQVALSFGVDDMGGTNLQEQVMREAGGHASKELSPEVLIRYAAEAGFEPCLVDSSYSLAGDLR